MSTILLVVHVLVAMALIGLVLLQHGKGADAGAAFGSGASATVFGARGSSSFLSRTTGVLAAVFFITSLSLAALSGRSGVEARSVVETLPTQPKTDVPAAPAQEGATSKPDVPVTSGQDVPAPASSDVKQ